MHAVRLEQNDYLKVGAGKHALAFRFNNYGGIDGFDFTTHCAPYARVRLPVRRPRACATAHISIGAAGHHPAHDPFVITRTA